MEPNLNVFIFNNELLFLPNCIELALREERAVGVPRLKPSSAVKIFEVVLVQGFSDTYDSYQICPNLLHNLFKSNTQMSLY